MEWKGGKPTLICICKNSNWKSGKWAIEYVCFNTKSLPIVPNQFGFHNNGEAASLFVCALLPWTRCNNSLKPGVIKTEYQRGLPPWFHETFRQKFQRLWMMKEGKLENGLLGSTALIVQKSHQINTEGHLQPFFSWAFQNGLSYENSEITKAPIRLHAPSFFSFSLNMLHSTRTSFHKLFVHLKRNGNFS